MPTAVAMANAAAVRSSRAQAAGSIRGIGTRPRTSHMASATIRTPAGIVAPRNAVTPAPATTKTANRAVTAPWRSTSSAAMGTLRMSTARGMVNVVCTTVRARPMPASTVPMTRSEP